MMTGDYRTEFLDGLKLDGDPTRLTDLPIAIMQSLSDLIADIGAEVLRPWMRLQ